MRAAGCGLIGDSMKFKHYDTHLPAFIGGCLLYLVVPLKMDVMKPCLQFIMNPEKTLCETILQHI